MLSGHESARFGADSEPWPVGPWAELRSMVDDLYDEFWRAPHEAANTKQGWAELLRRRRVGSALPDAWRQWAAKVVRSVAVERLRGGEVVTVVRKWPGPCPLRPTAASLGEHPLEAASLSRASQGINKGTSMACRLAMRRKITDGFRVGRFHPPANASAAQIVVPVA